MGSLGISAELFDWGPESGIKGRVYYKHWPDTAITCKNCHSSSPSAKNADRRVRAIRSYFTKRLYFFSTWRNWSWGRPITV